MVRSAVWVALLATIAGTSLGVGLNFADLHAWSRTRPLPPSELVNDARLPPLPPADGPQPVAVAEESEFDFGIMERDAKNSHVFTIRNDGGYPLVLKQGDTTCKCTMSKLAERPIEPGDSAEITLTWEAKSDSDTFRQTAEILTNDPQRPRLLLSIEGRIRASLAAIPPTFNLSGMLQTETREATTRVYSAGQADFQITASEFSNADLAPFFEASTSPLPEEELRPFDFKAGFLVTLRVKPGLPVGELRQTLRLKTNVAGAVPLEIPVLGVVAGPVSVVGRGWKAGRGNRGVLQIGAVARGDTARRELKFLVRGEKRQELKFSVKSTRPEGLLAHLGPAQPINEGAVMEIPLVIELAPDARPFRLLGATNERGEPVDSAFAEIIVECNDASVGSWQVLVKVALGAG